MSSILREVIQENKLEFSSTHCTLLIVSHSSLPLVCHESETASDSTGSGASRRGPHNPRRLRTGSGHLSRLRHLHEVTRLEDCVELLCCSSTYPQHTLLCPQAGGALLGRVAGFVTTRLRQCHTRRSTGIPDRSATVRVERRRPAGLLITEVRPRDAASS